MSNERYIWLPRGLTIIFALFLSLFAWDAFSGQESLLQNLIGFFYHLIPSLVVLGLLAVYWKEPFYGGIVFIVLSLLFTLFFHTYRAWSSFLLISLPLLVIGVLFILTHGSVKKNLDRLQENNPED